MLAIHLSVRSIGALRLSFKGTTNAASSINTVALPTVLNIMDILNISAVSSRSPTVFKRFKDIVIYENRRIMLGVNNFHLPPVSDHVIDHVGTALLDGFDAAFVDIIAKVTGECDALSFSNKPLVDVIKVTIGD